MQTFLILTHFNLLYEICFLYVANWMKRLIESDLRNLENLEKSRNPTSGWINYNISYCGLLFFVMLSIALHATFPWLTLLLFWPRALLKGPKRSFVVRVLVPVPGVESKAKDFRNCTKIVQGNKKCSLSLLWYILVLNYRVCLE